MRIFFFILLTTLTILYTKSFFKDSGLSPDEIFVNKINRKVFCQLKKEKDLYACGTGGQGVHEIKMLYCAFDYYNEIDIENARELIMSAGNLYLNEINSDERIRPYLAEYPFKNIEISIFLSNEDGSELPKDKIRIISMKEGILRYKIGILDSKGYRTIICEETFDEALKKTKKFVDC